jgi:hypothetical protein
MRHIRLTSLVFALALLAAVLTGCGSTGVGDILGGGSSSGGSTSGGSSTGGTYDDRYDTAGNVRGTVERVDTVDRRIIVDREGTYDSRNNLRNGNEDDRVSLYYDDRTTVQYQGKTFRPQDLEAGDRILADVNETGGRLVVEDIEVLQDVSSNGSTPGYDNQVRTSDVRGTISYIDTRERTLEIQTSGYSSNFSSGSTGSYGSNGSTGRSGVVLVHYDANTAVEYQGRSYKPENLERGDEVQVETREVGGRLMAEEILVVRDAQGR